jgi:hypothetical protein
MRAAPFFVSRLTSHPLRGNLKLETRGPLAGPRRPYHADVSGFDDAEPLRLSVIRTRRLSVSSETTPKRETRALGTPPERNAP